ncbi:MAG: ureidoglycolate lyase [Cyanobacteria bacterium J06631_2]
MPLLTVKQLRAIAINKENFQPYGELITPSPDGKAFDCNDAALQLQNGIPRFYIMHLEERGRTFDKITRHHSCTQCLGSLNGKDWFMAVCPPGEAAAPDLDCLQAFWIPGDCFIKLEVGTWHAGPYFDHETVDFYNLELSDTNIVDHFTHNFATKQQLKFVIVD